MRNTMVRTDTVANELLQCLHVHPGGFFPGLYAAAETPGIRLVSSIHACSFLAGFPKELSVNPGFAYSGLVKSNERFLSF
jgi:hypothetical protein